MRRIAALLVAASVTVALGGCVGSNAKSFDISPVFPLSSDKCAKYDGDQKGSGITATCMVTKDQCEKAAADWRTAMQNGGVHDAIMFRCG
jgi:uncharacterized lipoprotein YehR (DUF1307 family)